MQKKSFNIIFSVLVCFVLIFSSAFSVGAIDDKYEIDELGLSIKLPREYSVITRTTPQDDEAFKKLGLDYNETMTAFSAAHIYLQGASEDGVLKVTLTKTSDKNSEAINNYSDLSSSERKKVTEAFLSDQMYTSGTEVKHNGNIYIDLRFSQKTPESTIYGYQCHTVVNGMNINLTMQKNKEDLTADEVKVITNIANSVKFNKIKRNSSLAFDWWRVLLWILVLVAIAIAANYLYKFYTNTKKEKAQKRRVHNRMQSKALRSEEDTLLDGGSEKAPSQSTSQMLFDELSLDDDLMSFDEMLGYGDDDYHSRANTDLDYFDIDVKTKDDSKGVSFFEDYESSSSRSDFLNDILGDDDSDYFDDFFSEKHNEVEENREVRKPSSNGGGIMKRCSNFSKNLSKMISDKTKSKRK